MTLTALLDSMIERLYIQYRLKIRLFSSRTLIENLDSALKSKMFKINKHCVLRNVLLLNSLFSPPLFHANSFLLPIVYCWIYLDCILLDLFRFYIVGFI